MSENKNSEAEDVFEFLDSLPEAKNGGKMVNTDVKGSQEGVKGGSNSVAGKTGNDGKKGDDDIFEFLEELEKSNLSLTDKKGVEKKAPSESVNNKAQGEKVEESKENKNSEQDAHGKEKEPQQQEKEEEEEEEEEEVKKSCEKSRQNCDLKRGSISDGWRKYCLFNTDIDSIGYCPID